MGSRASSEATADQTPEKHAAKYGQEVPDVESHYCEHSVKSLVGKLNALRLGKLTTNSSHQQL